MGAKNRIGLPDPGVGVAFVDDPVKRHVVEPARRLAGLLDEPVPIRFDIHIKPAIGLDDVGRGGDPVVQSAQMYRSLRHESGDLLGEPLAVAVPGWRVEAKRVARRMQHGKLLEEAPRTPVEIPHDPTEFRPRRKRWRHPQTLPFAGAASALGGFPRPVQHIAGLPWSSLL
jgi:hypothetical protein